MKEFKIDRWLILVAAISLLINLIPAELHAQKHEKLYPLLEDIKGWKAEKAEGMSMDMPGMKMIQAMRIYEKGGEELSAIIVIGNAATMGNFTQMEAMSFESSEGKMVTKEIDGFMVYVVHDKEQDSGAVSVTLVKGEEESAMFMLTYQKLDEGKGLEIAKKFDWKKMKKTVEGF